MATPTEVAQLLAFVHERDVPCPACGYNLRSLTEPRCPECRQEVTLTVGLPDRPIGWLLATITPSSFSAIAAGLLLVPIVVVPLTGGGRAPFFIVALDAFGGLSGLGGLLVYRRRHAFLRLPPAVQRLWALGTWAIHVAAFVLLFIVAVS